MLRTRLGIHRSETYFTGAHARRTNDYPMSLAKGGVLCEGGGSLFGRIATTIFDKHIGRKKVIKIGGLILTITALL